MKFSIEVVTKGDYNMDYSFTLEHIPPASLNAFLSDLAQCTVNLKHFVVTPEGAGE